LMENLSSWIALFCKFQSQISWGKTTFKLI
jgi:hypothetical protein